MKKNTTTATNNPYKVGDIVCISWGYDMTIVQFYKVTRTTPSKVGLAEIEAKETYTGYLSGTCTPVPEKVIAGNNSPYSAHEDALYKVTPYGIRIPSYRGGHDYKTAYKYNGTPRTFNHCD